MHFCADIQIIDKEIEECVGKCQNGGVCANGECKCRKGYSGTYCQYKEIDSSPIFYYFMVFIVLIVIIVGLFYGAFMVMKQLVSSNGNHFKLRFSRISQTLTCILFVAREAVATEKLSKKQLRQ
jgi:hypothetical protein